MNGSSLHCLLRMLCPKVVDFLSSSSEVESVPTGLSIIFYFLIVFDFPNSKEALFTEFKVIFFLGAFVWDTPITCLVSRFLSLQACFCYRTEVKDLLVAEVTNASVAKTVFLRNTTLISRKLMLSM